MRRRKSKTLTPEDLDRERLRDSLAEGSSIDFHETAFLLADYGISREYPRESVRVVGYALMTILGMPVVEARLTVHEWCERHGFGERDRLAILKLFDQYRRRRRQPAPKDGTMRRQSFEKYRDLPARLTGREYDVQHLHSDNVQAPHTSETPKTARRAQVVDLAEVRRQRMLSRENDTSA